MHEPWGGMRHARRSLCNRNDLSCDKEVKTVRDKGVKSKKKGRITRIFTFSVFNELNTYFFGGKLSPMEKLRMSPPRRHRMEPAQPMNRAAPNSYLENRS